MLDCKQCRWRWNNENINTSVTVNLRTQRTYYVFMYTVLPQEATNQNCIFDLISVRIILGLRLQVCCKKDYKNDFYSITNGLYSQISNQILIIYVWTFIYLIFGNIFSAKNKNITAEYAGLLPRERTNIV